MRNSGRGRAVNRRNRRNGKTKGHASKKNSLLYKELKKRAAQKAAQRTVRLQKIKEEGKILATNAGSFIEHSIDSFVEHTEEAPVLEGEPASHVWYRIPVPGGISGDGSEYHIYLKKGTSENLCIFLSGGGVAWNEYTAARPVTGGRVAAGEPNFYWDNLRPITQIMNIGFGITDLDAMHNPFYDWSFVVITYTTGDFHVGQSDFPYLSEDGSTRQILHFHGKKNFEEGMKLAADFFPEPERLLIAGDSAGAFAVPAVAGKIVDQYYPACEDVTLFSDSAQLLCDSWQSIARDVWKADREVWEPITEDNLTVCWYRALLEKYPGRFHCLYASSTHDYLLSAYYNDMTNKVYHTDHAVRTAYFEQLREMIARLEGLDPRFRFFVNDFVNPLYTKAQLGTIHTAVRLRYFYSRNHHGQTMARWLWDQMSGETYDAGLELLK